VVAHLADEDDVGVLAQGAAQRVREGRRIDGDFALVDDRVVVPVQVLDRVLDGHDVRRARGVDVLDHGGQRGGLAAARGPGHEHQAALFLRDALEHRGQSQLVDRLDAGWNDAQHEADGATLLEHVAAEAPEARYAVRQDLAAAFP